MQDESQAGRGNKGNLLRRLTSESTREEQGHNFANLTGTLYREGMSESSKISIENQAVGGAPTDNTMVNGVTEKAATSSMFSEQAKNNLGNFFTFTMGKGTGAKIDTQKEDEDNGENDDSETQVSLSKSTDENEASANMENGYLDQFRAVRTINKTVDGIQKFMTMTN